MSMDLEPYLADLDARLDAADEQRVLDAWISFVRGELTEDYFVPPKRTPRPPKIDWPDVYVNDTLHDPKLMVYAQFNEMSNMLANGGNRIPNVRCNYGVGTMTSQLGCPVVEMPREQGNTPTTQPLPGGIDGIKAAIDRGVPDIRSAQGGDVFNCAELFLDSINRYPNLKKWVWLYHPDGQGPIDNAELAWGSEIFLAFHDEAELVHAFLDLMTEHYLVFMRAWFELVPPQNDEYSAHWGHLIPGQIMLRDDSLMNLPPDIFTTFIREREEKCLVELGNGCVHFCGRGDHFIEPLSEMKGLTSINLSQPQYNDMPTIWEHTVDKDLFVIGLNADAARDAGRELKGKVQTFKR